MSTVFIEQLSYRRSTWELRKENVDRYFVIIDKKMPAILEMYDHVPEFNQNNAINMLVKMIYTFFTLKCKTE